MRPARVLVVTGRPPAASGKGDQMRANALIEALEAAGHEVTVLCPQVGPAGRALAALGALLTGLPGQVGWMTPRRWWSRAVRLAADHDVAVAITARSARSALPCPLAVDHGDCLSRIMRIRASIEPRLAGRLAARVEARLLVRHERRLARWAVAHSAVSADEGAALPGEVRVIPIHHAGRVLEDPPGGRDIDVIFSGVMTYPPNRRAAELIAKRIAPELRRLRPQTRVALAGREADSLRHLAGVEIHTDVPDLLALLNRAKLAIAPMEVTVGQQNKLIDAACAGCAIVATPSAAEPVGYVAAVAEGPDDLAALAAELLDDEAAWERARAASRRLAFEHAPQRTKEGFLELVADADAHRR